MSATDMVGHRLAGKVGLVSGGSRGMGEAFARAIVAEGGKVVIGDVLDAEGAVVADSLGDAGTYVHLDVRNRDDWRRAVATAVDTYGTLNVLVNNAGIHRRTRIDECSEKDWDDVIAITLTGVFHGIAVSAEALRAGAPSSIINVSSSAGLIGYAASCAYTAAKFGVRGLSKSAALDLTRDGIRCNSIHPGAVDTSMVAGSGLPRMDVAMPRLADPRELAALVVFLASDESSFSTGSEFIADGGETAGRANLPDRQ